MSLNPHDLINLPGYGNAEKELRKAGMWDFTPLELIKLVQDDIYGKDALWLIDESVTILEEGTTT